MWSVCTWRRHSQSPLRHWPWYRTTWVLPFCEPGTTMVAAVAVADAAAVASAAVAASVDSTAAAVVVVVCVSTSAVVSTVAVNIATVANASAATVANASAAISTVTAAAANAATVSAAAVTRGSPIPRVFLGVKSLIHASVLCDMPLHSATSVASLDHGMRTCTSPCSCSVSTTSMQLPNRLQ